jgi:hypothetical protein
VVIGLKKENKIGMKKENTVAHPPAAGRVAALLKEHAGVQGQNTHIDRGVADLLRGHSRQLVEYGAAGRLAVRGEVEVLPLDDERLLQQAKPVTPDGRVRLDKEKVEARHDYQVKAALGAGAASLLILGGEHDLTAAVKRLGNGTTEYIRLTTKCYLAVSR